MVERVSYWYWSSQAPDSFCVSSN